VLSGFLITALLLLEIEQRGRVDFVRFWGARARRLVPAALIGLLLAGFVAQVTAAPGHVEGDAVSALLWMANWRFVASGQSYTSLFAHPSPLQHYWTLAVEEQFYLVLPLIVGATVVWVGRGRRQVFTVVTLLLLIGSLVVTRLLYQPGVVLRTYYGTDTRAAELLVGVLLAVVLVDRRGLRRFGRPARVLADVCAVPALVALVAMWCVVRQYDNWLLDGGLTLVALLAAVVLVGATQPGTFVGKVLSVRPLAWLGRISYGAYIYHWPLFLLLSPARTGLSGPALLALRLAVVLVVAQLSYTYIELPIREGRLPRPVAVLSWANAAIAVVGVFVLVVAGLPVAKVTLRADGAAVPPPPPPPPPAAVTTTAPPPPPSSASTVPKTRVPEVRAQTVANAPTPPPVTAPPPPPPVRVLVFGDSLAENLATGLSARAAKTHDMVVWDHGIPGCPISRGGTRLKADGTVYPTDPSCPWWGTEAGRQAVASFHADVVLVAGGLNDLYDRELPQWGSTVHHIGDPIFDPWLLSEYEAAYDMLAANGAHIVWTVPPCFDTSVWGPLIENAEARRQYHNSTILPLLDAARTVQPADLNQQLCPNGTFDPNALGINDSRPDGLHMTDAASESLAETWLAPLLLHAAGR